MDSRDDRNGDEGDCSSDSSCRPPSSGTGRETPCSCGPDCCGPGAQPGKRSRGILSLKSVVFVAVIAAAIAVAAWSLIKAKRSDTAVQAGERHEQALDLRGVSGADVRSSCSLYDIAPDKDCAFVLLAGADEQETTAAARAIKQISETLAQRGIQAAAMTIKPGNPDFERMVAAFDVAEFPAVVLLGKGSGPSVVTGEITEDELLRAYVRTTCAPGCASSECGADAGKSGCCSGQ